MVGIALYGLLFILSLFFILHLCILLKIVHYSHVWGGRLKSDKEMYRFEIVSVLINLLFILFILILAGFLPIDMSNTIKTSVLWIMTVLFLLNTIGNATSKNKREKRLFTPITILLALFSLILVLTI